MSNRFQSLVLDDTVKILKIDTQSEIPEKYRGRLFFGKPMQVVEKCSDIEENYYTQGNWYYVRTTKEIYRVVGGSFDIQVLEFVEQL